MHGRREGKRGGRRRAEEGLSEEGTLQVRYPDEGTGQVHNREPGRSRVTIYCLIIGEIRKRICYTLFFLDFRHYDAYSVSLLPHIMLWE